MIAEVAAGRVPPELQQALDALPTLSTRRTQSGLFALWQRAFGDGNQESVVSKITPFDDGGFFKRASLFWVHMRSERLEARLLAEGGSFGLFALQQDGIAYLH